MNWGRDAAIFFEKFLKVGNKAVLDLGGGVP